ncbi:hypothetical protein ONZ45_g6554 [Pleurotus djamor]|nr:hypothetical protein ONZ45_g6554 [Pleurotus djamor]
MTSQSSETRPLLGPLQSSGDEPDRVHLRASGSRAFRQELKALTRASIPVFWTYLLEYSLIMASVVSIGHLSTTALAAVTLGTMTANVSGFSVIQGLSAALDTMLPPAWTSPQPQLVGLWTQRMSVITLGCLIPVFCIWFNAERILLLARQDPEVAALAALYLKWASLGLPAYAFNCISRRYFQCQGLFSVPTRIIAFVAPINILLNYLLVWGPQPFGLGFIGAPIATAISFNIIALLSLIYGILFVPSTAWHPISSKMFTNLGTLGALGLAGVGQTASEWWAWELAGLAASLLGPVSLATQSILIVSSSCTFQVPYAIGIAASVRIGNFLGERKPHHAQSASTAGLLIGLAVSMITTTVFIVFRNSWAKLFNDDEEVNLLVARILPLVGLFQIFDAASAVAGGSLRARGLQALGAYLNLTGYYIIGLPIGILLAFKASMGLLGIWIGLTVALVNNCFWELWVVLRTDWKEEVQKVADRLYEEDRKTSPNASVSFSA